MPNREPSRPDDATFPSTSERLTPHQLTLVGAFVMTLLKDATDSKMTVEIEPIDYPQPAVLTITKEVQERAISTYVDAHLNEGSLTASYHRLEELGYVFQELGHHRISSRDLLKIVRHFHETPASFFDSKSFERISAACALNQCEILEKLAARMSADEEVAREIHPAVAERIDGLLQEVKGNDKLRMRISVLRAFVESLKE